MIILGLSTTVTSIINLSAMVGTVAGGGLGDVAIRYGYQRYSVIHMVAVIIIIFVIVMILQSIATHFARRFARRSIDSSRVDATNRAIVENVTPGGHLISVGKAYPPRAARWAFSRTRASSRATPAPTSTSSRRVRN